MHKRARALRGLQGAVDQFLLALAAQSATLKHIKGAENGGQQIVEIVRHPPGELSHGLEFPSLDERLLSLSQIALVLQALGDIRDKLESADPCARVVGERAKLDLIV